MVQGSMSCIKYLLFVFNFIFVICGLVLVIVGALASSMAGKKELTHFLDGNYTTAPVVIIIVGVVIFFVAFLGCCGAVRENHCMVMTFGLLIFVIFVVEIAGGITAYVYKGQVNDFLKKGMNSSLTQDKNNTRDIWDEMQSKWECCGVEGAQDYIAQNLTIPKSCCKDQKDPCDEDKAFKRGCYPLMLEKLKSSIAIVGGVAIGLGAIELLGCMFAWCLASAIKRDYEGV